MSLPVHDHRPADPTRHEEIRISRAWAYVAVFLATVMAMYAALGVARAYGHVSPGVAWALIGALALAAAVLQLFGLLEIGRRVRRWHAVALAMTLPLFALSVGLSVWMFHTLMLRTMLLH